MIATVNASAFGKLVKVANTVIEPKDTIRSNVEIRAVDGKLFIKATGNTCLLEMSTSAEVTEDGEAIVDGRMLYNIVQKATNQLTITSKDGSCVIRANGRTKLPIIDVSLPHISEPSGETIAVDAEAFKKLYGKISYAISEDQTRIVLTGALIECEGGVMKMTALDGFQMSHSYIGCEGKGRFIVPRKVLDTICTSVGDGMLYFNTDGNRIVATNGDTIVNGALLNGDYIDYDRLLPQTFATECLVNTESMRSALSSSLICTEGNNLLKMTVGEDKVTIRTNNQTADFEAVEDAKVRGNGLQIAFNVKYLIGAFNSIETEQAVMKFNQSISPMILTGEGSVDVHLILPVRVFN